MAKRTKSAPMDLELKQRLDQLGSENKILQKSMDEINEWLKGSTLLNYEGVIKAFEKIQIKQGTLLEQMAHWERWRQNQIAKKGTFTFRTADLFTKMLAVIGGIATVVAIIYTITQIIDWVHKTQKL
jgi:phosphoribosylformylglycinamidine (FGAM) synthase-like amidotransferase family enzyme